MLAENFRFGDPGRIRTCDPQIRNLMLYPAELRGHACDEPRCDRLWLAMGGCWGNTSAAAAQRKPLSEGV